MSCWRLLKGLGIMMTLDKSYDILERYYLLLDDVSNMAGYDVDSEYTRIKLEKVLSERPFLSIRGSRFLKELLSDDIGESVEKAIHTILNENL